MTGPHTDLRVLGDDLERAARRDLASRRGTRRRRIAMGAVAAAVLVSGGAFAASRLVDEHTVAVSLPAGTAALLGSTATCTELRPGVEYRCTVDRPPDASVEHIDDWTGTVEPTLDAASRVNGGCRSENAAGTAWRCYVGREAVRQGIVGQDFLGQPAGPGRG
ncbi:MAG: hypothetical protein IT200_16460 [Thermoleophilia bacterium]|nr:hypothetical protein [Thermoleophilia bacterium]